MQRQAEPKLTQRGLDSTTPEGGFAKGMRGQRTPRRIAALFAQLQALLCCAFRGVEIACFQLDGRGMTRHRAHWIVTSQCPEDCKAASIELTASEYCFRAACTNPRFMWPSAAPRARPSWSNKLAEIR